MYVTIWIINIAEAPVSRLPREAKKESITAAGHLQKYVTKFVHGSFQK